MTANFFSSLRSYLLIRSVTVGATPFCKLVWVTLILLDIIHQRSFGFTFTFTPVNLPKVYADIAVYPGKPFQDDLIIGKTRAMETQRHFDTIRSTASRDVLSYRVSVEITFVQGEREDHPLDPALSFLIYEGEHTSVRQFSLKLGIQQPLDSPSTTSSIAN